MLLEGKRCIVSGIGPGLGREIALLFARNGADLAIGARTESYLNEVAQEVEALGKKVVAIPTDITNSEQCDALAAGCVDAFGGIDVVVHNAFAPDAFQMFEDVDLDAWRHIVDVNHSDDEKARLGVNGFCQLNDCAQNFTAPRGLCRF